VIRIFTFFAILLLLSFAESFAGTYSGGDGSVGDPYQISSTDDLIELSNTSADWVSGIYFIQTADITFDSDETQADWDGDGNLEHPGDDEVGFLPIGSVAQYFRGNYDGQNHTIDNLFINRPTSDFIGLFGYTTNASIQNIGATNVSLNGKDYVGGLIGFIDAGAVSIIYSTGIVSGSGDYVGGVIGYTATYSGSITISDNYSTASVSGYAYVGGLVGNASSNSGSLTMSNCYSTGNVSGIVYVGGLIGTAITSSDVVTIRNCYSTSTVSGTDYVGGFVGYAVTLTGFLTINNNYSTGNVTRSSGSNDNLGGFCGNNSNSTIVYCYSIGKVYESTGVIWDEAPGGKDKGFVGINVGGTHANNFFDETRSEQESGIGATAKSVTAMKAIATYTDYTDGSDGLVNPVWDFVGNPNDDAANIDIWNINASINSGYPYLNNLNYVPDLNIIYVNASRPDDAGNGSSWATAKKSLQAALDIAINGDQIWVAVGTYYPTTEVGGSGDRYKSFQMINEVSIFGGFAGTEDHSTFDLADRDFELNQTILSGDLGTENDNSDNSVHVVYNISVNNTAVLDGFTIMNGNSNLGNLAAQRGGGMLNLDSSPIIINCKFVDNVAGAHGGAIYNANSSPIFTNCLIVNNSSGNAGGAVYSQTGDPSFINCSIIFNSSSYAGAIANNFASTTATLINCIVWGNVAGFENPIWNNQSSNTIVSYSAIQGGYSGTGNISSDPIFFDPDNQDYRLLSVSPAVDAGDNSYNTSPSDVRGHARIQNTTIDMGAFEWTDGVDPLCNAEVWVSDDYDSNTPNWGYTYFDNINYALLGICNNATINISNYTHTGNVDMTGYTFIIGDDDFDLDGELTGGLIQTPSTGRLILPAEEDVQIDFPMGDGNNNYTLKIIPLHEPTTPIMVRLKEQSIPGAIQDPMQFWEIEGDDDLNATIIFRIDKSAIAPKKLDTNSLLRSFNGNIYKPFTEEHVTINDKGTYYEIIIINVNKF
jgi:hypothetical protein